MSEVTTAYGPARLDIDHPAGTPRALLVLGHGAGGGVDAVDLVAVRDAAVAAGATVARATQPYRVAGRRAPAPARQLDAAFTAVVAAARAAVPAGTPLVVGGRSSGARVACRTAAELGAAGVLCLAFPLHPPGRPEKTRLPELEQVTVPVLIVQGESDPFGMPPDAPNRRVVRLKGNHSLKSDVRGLRAAVTAFLSGGNDGDVD